jgi:hypothetical protein
MVPCCLIPFYCVHLLVPHVLAQNVRPLDEICNLFDPSAAEVEEDRSDANKIEKIIQVFQPNYNL